MPKKKEQKVQMQEKHPEIVYVHHRRWSMIVPLFSFLLLIFAISLAVYLRYFAYTVNQQYGVNSTNISAIDSIAPVTSSGSSGSGVATSTEGKTVTSTSDPLVVRMGSFVITVNSASDAVQKISDAAKDLKGSVVSSFVSEKSSSCSGGVEIMIYPSYGCYDATIVIRVPAASYDAAKDAIKKVDENAKFDSESTQEVDVTTQESDLQTQLTSYTNEQASLQKLLDSATGVDDILKIRNELTIVDAQVQNLKIQIRDLNKNVQYSELTVSISKLGSSVTDSTPSISGRFATAWAAMKVDLSNLGTGLIYVVVYALIYIPVLLILLVAFWLIKRWAHRSFKKK